MRTTDAGVGAGSAMVEEATVGRNGRDGSSRPKALILRAAAVVMVGTWLAFMLRVPALRWTEQPLPFPEIHRQAQMLGPVRETAAILLLLLAAYFAMVWMAWTSPADLPARVVLPVAALSGLLAVFTYALFAEDVNFVLSSVWAYAVAGVNPYEVPPNAAPGNPYAPFASWGSLQNPYGPAWLLVGTAVMRAVGPGVLVNVAATKLLLLGTFWALGALAWWLARARGSDKPVAAAALVLWNPLLLIESAMTPHLDLPMAAALLAGLLAWARRREPLAVVWFGLSVAVKLVTVVLAPALALSLGVAGTFRQRGLVWAVAGTGVVFALLWPVVWRPYLLYALPWSADVTTTTALIPNLITVLQALGLLPPEPSLDPVVAAKRLRWLVFVPFWAGATALCALVAWRRRRELPLPLCEPLALLLLGYHTLFTLAVLPWHFTTALCLCLCASSRRGQAAGLLLTLSGALFYLNDMWTWNLLWPDMVRINWVLGASLLTGPIIAIVLLCRELWGDVLRSAAPTHNPTIRAAPGPELEGHP